MKTTFLRRAGNFLFVLVFVIGAFGQVRVQPTYAQSPAQDGGTPQLKTADSQKMLPPKTPVIRPNGPAPFLGTKPASPRPAESTTRLQPDRGMVQQAPEKAERLLMDGQENALQSPSKSTPPSKSEGDGPLNLTDLPNLFAYQPYDWDSPVVLSIYTGTTGNSTLTEGENVYVDWSIANGGADIPTSSFVSCLYLDNTAFYCSDGIELPGGYYWPNFDQMMSVSPGAGWHTIELYTDVYNQIAETDETDNGWSASFYWYPNTSGKQPNLYPYNIGGMWDAPVVLSSQVDATASGNLTAGKPFYLNMATLNEGPGDINEGQPFTVSIDIDDALVYQITWEWGLPAQYYLYETNYWIDTSISEGWHSVTLSIDSNYTISEAYENDNIWSGWFYWEAPAKANLVPFTPTDWSGPVIVTSSPGIEGDPQLFVDRTTYISFAYMNEGNAPTNQFYVNILLDGSFLMYYWEDLEPWTYGTYIDYALPAGSLSPGWHTIRLWLDDTNTVDEYNEDDNSWEADFYWETSSLPNLHPFQPDGWDDALVVSSIRETNTFNALTTDQPVYFDWAVINDGWGDLQDGKTFDTAIVIDGEEAASWSWSPGLGSGWYLYLTDYSQYLNDGWHYLELRTDTKNNIVESNEADNTTGYWVYIGETTGVPEIRIEPTDITIDVSSGAALEAQTEAHPLQRDMSRVQPFDATQFGLGAEISPPTRYILPKVPLTHAPAASLPATVDHADKLPPVGNQGSAGSCTSWATSYYYKSYQEGLDQGWDLNTAAHQFSPNFVWNQIQPSSTCGGTFPSDAFELITNVGDIPLSEMPYSTDCKAQPSANQLDLATNYRAENYGAFFQYGTRPNDTTINLMKEWLAGGDLIQLSIPVYPEFDSPSGPYCIVDGPNQGQSRGGHAITIVGYDDNIGGLGKKGFKIVNSWGTYYGCNGFSYLTYDWVKTNAWEAWWMKDIRTGSNKFRDFTIFNDGTGALTVSQVAKMGNSAWLQVVLPEALPMVIEPGEAKTIQLAIDPGGLGNGTFRETVLVSSDDADEPQSQVQVTLNNGAPGTLPPPSAESPQPADRSYNQPENGLTLRWETKSAPAGLMYDVRLDTSNPPAAVVCNDQTSTECQVNSLRPFTTYYWRVVSLTAMHSTLGPVWQFTTGGTPKAIVYLPIVTRK